MEENFKNKLGFWLFTILVLFLLIGGYFFTKYVLEDHKEKKEDTQVKTDYKIDKDKDFIYYTNEIVISEEAEIYYKDVVINISTASELTKVLERENQSYKNNIQYVSDVELPSDILDKYNKNDIYLIKFRSYENYEYDKYISLVINEFYYGLGEINYDKSISYVFDTTTGEELDEAFLLNKYGLNMDDVKTKVKSDLESKQTIIEDKEVIKIDDTLNNFDNYAIYINDLGKLCITYLVKTTQVDYNEITEVN